MLKGLVNIEQEFNVLFGSIRDGSDLHSPSGVPHPSSSGIVALIIRQTGCPLFGRLGAAFSIGAGSGEKKGDGAKAPI